MLILLIPFVTYRGDKERTIMTDARDATHTNNELLAKEAVTLTKMFVRRFWQGQRDWCYSILSENASVIWHELKLPRSRREYIDLVREIDDEDSPLMCSNEEFRCILSEWPIAIVTGQYLASTDPSTKQISAQLHRMTFVWRVGEAGLRIIHYHDSSPMARREGERFNTWIGRENYAYMRAILNRERRSRLVSFRDTGGSVHWVMPEDIIYATAHRQYTDIQCSDQTITLRKGIGEIVEQRKGILVRVHRSYAINPAHLKSMEGNILHLDDGTDVEVPRKRLSQVRKELMREHIDPADET